MTDKLLVYGSGGHAKAVIDAALARSPEILIQLFDDNPDALGNSVLGFEVVGGRERLLAEDPALPVALAIGGNADRSALTAWLDENARILATIIHPFASVSPRARVEDGSFIAAGAIVIAGATIGRGAIVNTAAGVDHDCRIGRAAHIAPGARLCGNVTVGERTLIGVGAAICPGVSIGDDVVIGAGSAVIADLAAGGRFAGCPARAIE